MNKDTCGTCENFDPNNVVSNDWIGDVHVCKKGHICNSWNLNNSCKDFSLDDKVFYKEVNDKFRDAVDIRMERRGN